MRGDRSAQNGFALVTALWAALILALLAAYALQAARTSARVTRTAATQAALRGAADAVLAETELRLFAPNVEGIPLDGTGFPTRFGTWQAAVRVQDQAGLIDINFVDEPSLLHLLISLGGLELSEAQKFADRILDWRERGIGRRLQGAKGAEYQAAGYAYGPRQAPFESVEEMKLVFGMTADLYARISSALTIYSQQSVVDRAVAPEAALRALPGLDDLTIGELLAARQRLEAAGDIGYGNLTGHCLRISVRVMDDQGAVTVAERVIRLTGGADSPYWTYVEN